MHSSIGSRLTGWLEQRIGCAGVADPRLEYSRALASLDVERLVGTPAGEVYFRPLPALQRVAEVIGARMAEQFGALPRDS